MYFPENIVFFTLGIDFVGWIWGDVGHQCSATSYPIWPTIFIPVLLIFNCRWNASFVQNVNPRIQYAENIKKILLQLEQDLFTVMVHLISPPVFVGFALLNLLFKCCILYSVAYLKPNKWRNCPNISASVNDRSLRHNFITI